MWIMKRDRIISKRVIIKTNKGRKIIIKITNTQNLKHTKLIKSLKNLNLNNLRIQSLRIVKITLLGLMLIARPIARKVWIPANWAQNLKLKVKLKINKRKEARIIGKTRKVKMLKRLPRKTMKVAQVILKLPKRKRPIQNNITNTNKRNQPKLAKKQH